jgi:hypothetical protein
MTVNSRCSSWKGLSKKKETKTFLEELDAEQDFSVQLQLQVDNWPKKSTELLRRCDKSRQID